MQTGEQTAEHNLRSILEALSDHPKPGSSWVYRPPAGKPVAALPRVSASDRQDRKKQDFQVAWREMNWDYEAVFWLSRWNGWQEFYFAKGGQVVARRRFNSLSNDVGTLQLLTPTPVEEYIRQIQVSGDMVHPVK